jgi:hypothetical protein
MLTIDSIANLTLESIAKLTLAELKAQIRCRGGHVQDRAKSLQYLRKYLWDLREVKPNVVYVPKKRRNSGVSKPVAPVQTVQVVASMQTIEFYSQTSISVQAAEVFGFLPRYDA